MENALILRVCDSNLRSFGGFQWPESGPIQLPLDKNPKYIFRHWDPKPECGNGLHGWLWGEGDSTAVRISKDSKWLVVQVPEASIVDLKGKVKFPKGDVVFSGDREGATQYLLDHGGATKAIIHRVLRVGDGETATVGAEGKAYAGDGGKAYAGDDGEAFTGHHGFSSAGSWGKALTGDHGTAIAGKNGHVTAGDYGTASTLDPNGYTSGYAEAGKCGRATVGVYGTAIVGEGGIAQAGMVGTLIFKLPLERLTFKVAFYRGIHPDTAYRLVGSKLVACP